METKPSILLFDLGGVIIDLYPQKTIAAFAQLANKSEAEVLQAYEEATIFQQHEKGLINNEAFRSQLKLDFRMEASDQDFDLAWNAMLGDIPSQAIEAVKQLKENYTCCVLSNTNAIHEKAFHETLSQQHQFTHLDQLFDQVFFSHELHERKPDQAIYHKVVEALKVPAEQILFLDDSEVNVAAAQQAGMQSIHIPRNGGFSQILNTYLAWS